ncbi:MAG TPA: hypothetical protein VFK03_04325, partial [Candidatus Saccharimonadales bacterium]|nr:hypothetical protein [Candidatus Saccharimonadales bacterium]
IAGKPAFEVPDEPAPSQLSDTPAPAPTVETPVIPGGGRIDHGRRLDERGRKIIPEVQVIRCQYHLSGQNLEVSAFIRNNSDIQVELNKVNVFGRLLQLDRWLKPGEEHETVVYRGPLLKADAYRVAELYYKDCGSGDYFCALHQVEYRREADGSFLPHGFHLIHPIKDV